MTDAAKYANGKHGRPDPEVLTYSREQLASYYNLDPEDVDVIRAERDATILSLRLKLEEMEKAVRRARALADHVIHGEQAMATVEDVHQVLSEALSPPQVMEEGK